MIRWSCKVGDFGMSRNINSKEYYRPAPGTTPIPVRWSAVECLESMRLSTASDVWSFGVLMVEIWEDGDTPYGEWANHKVVIYVAYRRMYSLRKFLACVWSSGQNVCCFHVFTRRLQRMSQLPSLGPRPILTQKRLRGCSIFWSTPQPFVRKTLGLGTRLSATNRTNTLSVQLRLPPTEYRSCIVRRCGCRCKTGIVFPVQTSALKSCLTTFWLPVGRIDRRTALPSPCWSNSSVRWSVPGCVCGRGFALLSWYRRGQWGGGRGSVAVDGG